MSARQRESVDPLLAGFGLLALWIAIELFYSSGWLRIDAILRSAGRQRLNQARLARVAPKLITVLEAMPAASRRVWFAPYTTFPETGVIESRSRSGIYDTFLTFPRSGISSNYGALNLSAADSLFAQASSQGVIAEAHLAQSLGYRQFALDLGAISQPSAAAQLCRRSEGCRISGDAYALFPLDAGRTGWIAELKDQERNIPLLPQISAAPRWGGLVGQPNQWWPSTSADLTPGDGRLRLRARPLWNLELYRYPLAGLPAATRRLLNPQGLRVRVLLGPGLRQVDLCLSSAAESAAGRPCHGVNLRSQDPAIDISRWIEPGTLTAIEVTLLLGRDGVPTTMQRLVPPGGRPNEPSPFTLEIQPPPSPQP